MMIALDLNVVYYHNDSIIKNIRFSFKKFGLVLNAETSILYERS